MPASALRVEGYVIVSADGHLTDASGVQPDVLRFPGDHRFLMAALDRADLIVHGRNSFDDQADSARRRIVVTRKVDAVAGDPLDQTATLWNPAGASFGEACAAAAVASGTVAVIGGPAVFALFLDRYDTFFLSQAPHVTLPGGAPCFPGAPGQTPQQVLAAHGLRAAEVQVLDPEHDVTVTAWQRDA